MARPWRIISRFFRSGLRPLAFGLTAGLVAGWLVMALALPLLYPTAAQAQQVATTQNASQFCMPAVQCHKSMVSQSQCFSGEGCCYEDRCFQLGSPCTTTKTGGSTDKAASTGLCYARSQKIDLTVQIGDAKSVLNIGEYIAAVYKYGVGIAAFLAAIMMMVGGFMYLTAGDSSRVSRGKSIIMDSLLGLGVALSAYVLLNTINPDLVKLQLPKIPIVKKQAFVGCTLTELCAPCGAEYTVYVSSAGEPPPAGDCKYVGLKDKTGKVTGSPPSGWTAGATCVGKSCALAAKEGGLSGAKKEACGDAKARCRIPGSVSFGIQEVDKNIKTIDQAYAGSCGVAKDNPQGYVCAPCVQDGGDCAKSGKDDACCSGFCGDNECSAGLPGSYCDDDKECLSGICQTNFYNSCSSGEVGAPCDETKECLSGICQTKGKNTCSPGTAYSWCSSDDECASGYKCDTSRNACVDLKGGTGFWKCDFGGGCNVSPNLFCNKKHNFCTSGEPGVACEHNEGCKPPENCYYPMADGSKKACAGMCAQDIHTCTAGQDGVSCDDGYDCASGRCASTKKGMFCVSGTIGSNCTSSKTVTGVDTCNKGLTCKTSGEGLKSCQYQ